MVLDIYETESDDPEEPAENNEVRLALGLRVNENGELDPEDVPWKIDFNGEGGRVEIIDEENETVAYIDPNSGGNLLGGASGGEFVDTNDDGTAVLQSDTVDFDAKPAQNLAAPSNDSDAARKSDVDSVQSDVDGKADDPHALGGESHSSDTLANLNAKIDDAELDDSSETRPPEEHNNAAHSATYVSDGDGAERQIWVIAAGASDPAEAGPDDLIFEEES